MNKLKPYKKLIKLWFIQIILCIFFRQSKWTNLLSNLHPATLKLVALPGSNTVSCMKIFSQLKPKELIISLRRLWIIYPWLLWWLSFQFSDDRYLKFLDFTQFNFNSQQPQVGNMARVQGMMMQASGDKTLSLSLINFNYFLYFIHLFDFQMRNLCSFIRLRNLCLSLIPRKKLQIRLVKIYSNSHFDSPYFYV